MAAAPQFDLFAGAKGYEYARDRNTQDEDNALKTRQNEMALTAFERQLKEHEQGAELRRLTRENQTTTAKGRGVTLQQQLAYQTDIGAARASLTPDQLADTSPMGYLNRTAAMQRYLQTKGANPASIEAFGKEIQTVKSAVLGHLQYDPEKFNTALQHPLLGGGEYRVDPIAGKDGQFQMLKRGERTDEGPAPYLPVQNQVGNMASLSSSMISMMVPGTNPFRGQELAYKMDNDALNRQLKFGADMRAGNAQLLSDKRYAATNQTNQQRIAMQQGNNQHTAAQRYAVADMANNQKIGTGLHKEHSDLMKAINTAMQKGGDVNHINGLRAQLAAVNERIVAHSAKQTQAPWAQMFAPPPPVNSTVQQTDGGDGTRTTGDDEAGTADPFSAYDYGY